MSTILPHMVWPQCEFRIIIITDEYDLGGTVALLLQDHLTMLIVSHVTTNQSTTA